MGGGGRWGGGGQVQRESDRESERPDRRSAASRSTDLEFERMQPVVLNLDLANDPQSPIILVDDAKHQVPVPGCHGARCTFQ